ncbi:GNAT family N-acetyltransferase [Arthrobacter sp. TMT4-20]
MSRVLIEGRQIRLRDWRPEDLSAYREWLKPHHEWNLWDGPYFPPHTLQEADAAVERIKEQLDSSEWPEVRRRLVIADGPTNQLLGTVSWHWE